MAPGRDPVDDPFTARFIKFKADQLCRRRDFTRSEYNDLQQGMRLHLLEKARLFDPARAPLEAFVTNVVNSWIGMELRFRGRLRRRGNSDAISLEGTTAEFSFGTDTLDNLIGAADLERRTRASSLSPIDRIVTADAVRHAFAKLTRSEQRLLTHVAEHGVASAAREWSRRLRRKVSRRWVENAVKQMRARFEDSGLGSD